MYYLPIGTIAFSFCKIIYHDPHITFKKFPYLFCQMSHLKHMDFQFVYIFPCFLRDLPPLKKLPAVTVLPPPCLPPVKHDLDHRKQVWHLIFVLLTVKPACVTCLPKDRLAIYVRLVGNQIDQVDPTIQHLIFTQVRILAAEPFQPLVYAFCRPGDHPVLVCHIFPLVQQRIDHVFCDIRV